MNEELKVVITVEGQKATRQMKEFGKTTDSVDGKQKKMKKTLGDVKAGWLGATAAIAGGIAVIKKVSDVVKQYVDAASDAEEISSKFAVTFGDMSVTAEHAAETLAESYGLAESTAKDLMSATGDMLSGFGATDRQALQLSTKVQQLAVDLASFTNYSGGAKGAADALTKGLLGEREMMKSLGIAISEADVKQRLLEKGQQDLEGTALKMARAEITLELAYEQSQNSLGDYARTQESYANASRRAEEANKALNEQLGRMLLPTLGKVKGAIADFKLELAKSLQTINDYSIALKLAEDGLQTFAETQAYVAAETNLFSGVMDKMQKGIGKISPKEFWEVRKATRAARKEGESTLEAWRRLTKETKLNQTVLENMERISKRNEQLAANKKEIAEQERQKQKQITAELEKQKKLSEERYKEAISLIEQWGLSEQLQHALELREAYNKLFNLPGWSEAPENLWKIRAHSESIKNLNKELAETLFPQVFDFYEKITEASGMHKDEVEETVDSYQSLETKMNAIARSKYFDSIINGNKKIIDQENEKLSILEGSQLFYDSLSDTISSFFEMQLEGLDKESEKYKKIKRDQANAAKVMGIFETTINTAAAVTKALTAGPILGPILAAAIGVMGAAQIAMIAATPIPQFAQGGDFVTSGPQAIMVGDNPGGRERVSVTPLSSPNVAGPGGGVTIAINAPVYGVNDLYYKLKSAGNTLSRRGRG